MDDPQQVTGQDVNPPLYDYLSHTFINIDLAREEILKYLDGSTLIQLSSVSKGIREVVTSLPKYKQKVNLRVTTKSMDYFTRTVEPLPEWTANLIHLTLVCNSNSEFVVCHEKFSSLAPTLPNLSDLEVINESPAYTYATTFINKVLSLSSNLKSLSLPYDLMLNPIDFLQDLLNNLEELKFTTSSNQLKSIIMNNENFRKNLNILANNCINLKSFSCEEVVKIEGQSVNLDDDDYGEFIGASDYDDDNDGILTIIENNSAKRLEKLELGISKLFLKTPYFSSKFVKVSLPNLKSLDLSAINDLIGVQPPVLEILNKLPHPGQLVTLKLTVNKFPIELFSLIPQKFPQIKSLSLTASRFLPPGENKNEDRWSFLQSLTALEELEITRLEIDGHTSDFGFKISDNFPDYIHKNNLRKFSLKGMESGRGPEFYNGIAKMIKLKELVLTQVSVYLDDFLKICTNLKALEKLEISDIFAYKFNPQSTTHQHIIGISRTRNYGYREIRFAFSSLKHLKELSIRFYGDDFGQAFLPISVPLPYLKSLSLYNAHIGKDDVENIIESNVMLKELTIVNFQIDDSENFEIVNERNNLKIDLPFN